MTRYDIGREWEKKAGVILTEAGYQIEQVPEYYHADLKVVLSNEVLNVNVKSAKELFGVQESNLRALLSLNSMGRGTPSFLFINDRVCALFTLKRMFYFDEPKKLHSSELRPVLGARGQSFSVKYIKKLPRLTCIRCGHEWTPRKATVRRCPNGFCANAFVATTNGHREHRSRASAQNANLPYGMSRRRGDYEVLNS